MDSRNLPEDDSLLEARRFQILVESIRDYAIYMLDIEGKITSWNSGAERFKGFKEDEIIGQHFSRFYTSEDQQAGVPLLALRTSEETGKYAAEGWRVRKDGTRFWASVVIDSIRSANGELLGFAKITQDITERKMVEQTLRQSEQQFRLLVQGVTDYAIYMLDVNGLITNWNAGAQRIKGFTQSEVVGTHFSRFYTAQDRELGLPAKALKTAMTEGRYEQEGSRVRKDGTTFMVHVIIDAIYNDLGELIGYAKVTRDITEKQEALAALKRTEQALQQAQKMETIGKLTGGIAHDFNNLLQIIAGNLHLIATDVVGNERAERRVAGALGGVSRGAKLASYLLAFARRQALDPKVVNIGRLLFSMDDMLRRSLGDAIEIETSISGGLWNTLVDVAQLENAVLNLSINARDAMNESGKLTLEVGNAFLDDAYARNHAEVVPGQYVMLAVTDTGTGMTPEVVNHAFDPFYSTKPEGKGTGLGLSMVYGFVKQSGGHIAIYSEVGYGTTVKMYLPRALESEDALEPALVESVVGGSETILVAEDDEDLCETVVEMLGELGYNVLKVNDAAGALAIIQSGVKIDLLFTDVVMPGVMRSPEMVRKAREFLPNLAVLYTSGYTQNAIVHGGRLDPGVELLGKPYTREALARKIRHVINNQLQRGHGTRTTADAKASARPLLNKTQGLDVLLVEDDDQIRDNTAQLLQQMGHTVTQAANAPQAIDLLGKIVADVMITDIGLPGMSGDKLAERVREKHPSIGIVFATGQATVDVDMSDSRILRKPYTFSSLENILKSFKRR
jgi:PAS domain S-box-containing protein